MILSPDGRGDRLYSGRNDKYQETTFILAFLTNTSSFSTLRDLYTTSNDNRRKCLQELKAGCRAVSFLIRGRTPLSQKTDFVVRQIGLPTWTLDPDTYRATKKSKTLVEKAWPRGHARRILN